MKTIVISLFTATLLGLASQFSSHSVNAAEFTSILFASGLLAWTVNQYSNRPTVLTANSAQIIHLPIRSKVERLATHGTRMAA